MATISSKKFPSVIVKERVYDVEIEYAMMSGRAEGFLWLRIVA